MINPCKYPLVGVILHLKLQACAFTGYYNVTNNTALNPNFSKFANNNSLGLRPSRIILKTLNNIDFSITNYKSLFALPYYPDSRAELISNSCEVRTEADR